jgi:transketolase
LPNMTAFVPAFTEDISQTLERAGDLSGPAYVRLGRGEKPKDEVVPKYTPWRRLLDGDAGVMIAVGPLAGSSWDVLRQLEKANRPALWVVSELPIEVHAPPSELTNALKRTRRLAVIEEHVAHGGVGQAMCHWVIDAGMGLDRFRHLHAVGSPGSTYGSQAFLRRRSSLDPEGIALAAKSLAS